MTPAEAAKEAHAIGHLLTELDRRLNRFAEHASPDMRELIDTKFYLLDRETAHAFHDEGYRIEADPEHQHVAAMVACLNTEEAA